MDGPNANWSVQVALVDLMSSMGLSSLGLKLLGGKSKKILKACGGYSMTLQPEEIHILP